MSPPTQGLQQVIQQLLTQEGRHSQDPHLAGVTARVYEQFAYRLSPLVGDRGIRAILARSAKLRQAEFPFLAGDVLAGPSEGVPAKIWAALNRQDPATVRKASEALLITFASLLVNLIGERLTWRLLFNLSPEPFSSGPGQERTG